MLNGSKNTKGDRVLVGKFEIPCDGDLADSSRQSSFHCSTCGSSVGSIGGSKNGSVLNNSHHPGVKKMQFVEEPGKINL